MKETRVLAFDIGASSGRAMLGVFDGNSIQLVEVHRFTNDPVVIQGIMYWDVLRLFHEIKQGILKAKYYGEFESIGIDTWGVDFGLLDKEGRLLENPIHYRDNRTQGMLEKSLRKVSKEEFYRITGNQFMEINTVFQLMSLSEQRHELLNKVDTLLLMPDLFNYFLTGMKVSEYSIVSTTQLMDAHLRTWSDKLMSALSLPMDIFTKIVPSGTCVGKLSQEISKELGVKACNVIAVAGHDTQSAMVAVPTEVEDFIFISCGTWSLFGTELKEPLINEETFESNMTNEGGYGNKISLLKNITGLWLIQECKRQWSKDGKEYDFGELEDLVKTELLLEQDEFLRVNESQKVQKHQKGEFKAIQELQVEKEIEVKNVDILNTRPSKYLINPDAKDFLTAGDMPSKIQEFCRKTKQEIPQSIGQITRCIYQSLALKYRMTFEEIKKCTCKEYKRIYMIGGGVKSKLLCQLTADVCGCEVIAGPIEATVLGNIAQQLISIGAIKDIKEVREFIGKDPGIISYVPNIGIDSEVEKLWDNSYKQFKKIVVTEII